MLKCQADVLLLSVIKNVDNLILAEKLIEPQTQLLPSETSKDTCLIFICRKKNLMVNIAYPTEEDLANGTVTDENILNLYQLVYNSFSPSCSQCEYSPQATNSLDT